MRQWFGSVMLTTAIVSVGVCSCRPKANRAVPVGTAASVIPDAAVVSNPVQPPNQRNFEPKPIDTDALVPVRLKASAALQKGQDSHTAASDRVAALARALNDAPGSAVLALELAKAARRAHDQNRLAHFLKIVRRSVTAFPVLEKPAESVGLKRSTASPATGQNASAQPEEVLTQRLNGVDSLENVCGWLTTSFKQGQPPIDYVGEQATDSPECQQTAVQPFAPELQARTVTVRVGGPDERVFAWVAVRFNASVWLSPVVAESFAPALHPQGNGFFVELQKTEAYKGGLPELAAYVTERSTVLDVILNEMVVTDRHRVVVMTFDGRLPQTSAPILLHASVSRALLDPSDTKLPKGYKHSLDLGKTTAVSYRLEWAQNHVRLSPSGSGVIQTKTLFADD